MNEQEIRAIIRDELRELLASDRYIFNKNIQILEARNVQLGKTTGTKFGTATDQKIGFLGATPIIRQGIAAPYTDAATIAATAQALIDFGLLYRNN